MLCVLFKWDQRINYLIQTSFSRVLQDPLNRLSSLRA